MGTTTWPPFHCLGDTNMAVVTSCDNTLFPRVLNIYTWLTCTYGMKKNGSHFSLPLSLSLFLLCPHRLHRMCSFLSQLSSFYSRSCSAFSDILYVSLAACLELQSTKNLWITCPCSRPLSEHVKLDLFKGSVF